MYLIVFIFSLSLLSSFIHAESLEEDVVKDIIAYRKDHVERFKDLAALTYSQEWSVPAILEEKTLRLLCGLEGLRKGPQKKERYQQQVQWAIDFIQRSTYDTLTKSGSEPRFANPFLDKIKNTLSTTALNDTLTQHISFSVLFSMISHWHIDREFAKKPAFKDIALFDFIKNKKAYESLGDYADQFYTFITKKLSSIDKMNDYLQENYFEEIWQHNKEFLKIPFLSEENPSNKIHWLSESKREEIELNFENEPYFYNPLWFKTFNVKVKGTEKGVKGDGACFYHTYRDAFKAIDWEAKDCNEQSRAYIAKLILKNLVSPLARFLVSTTLSNIDLAAIKYVKEKDYQEEWSNIKEKDLCGNGKDRTRFYYSKPHLIEAYVNNIILGTNEWVSSRNDIAWLISYLNQWNIITLAPEGLQIADKVKIAPFPQKHFWLMHSINHFMYMENPTLSFTESKGGA